MTKETRRKLGLNFPEKYPEYYEEFKDTVEKKETKIDKREKK